MNEFGVLQKVRRGEQRTGEEMRKRQKAKGGNKIGKKKERGR